MVFDLVEQPTQLTTVLSPLGHLKGLAEACIMTKSATCLRAYCTACQSDLTEAGHGHADSCLAKAVLAEPDSLTLSQMTQAILANQQQLKAQLLPKLGTDPLAGQELVAAFSCYTRQPPNKAEVAKFITATLTSLVMLAIDQGLDLDELVAMEVNLAAAQLGSGTRVNLT